MLLIFVIILFMITNLNKLIKWLRLQIVKLEYIVTYKLDIFIPILSAAEKRYFWVWFRYRFKIVAISSAKGNFLFLDVLEKITTPLIPTSC